MLWSFCGIITTMKSLAQLDQLNLDATTKQQVVDIVQTLLDQAQQQAQQEIRAQGTQDPGADIGIGAFTPYSIWQEERITTAIRTSESV